MAYRTYIGYITNNKYRIINKIETSDDLKKFLNLEEIYDFFDEITTIDEISDEALHLKKESQNFFLNKELNNEINEGYDLFIINKEKLLKLIEIYEKLIKDFYKNKFEEIMEIKNKEEDIEYAFEKAMYIIKQNILQWERTPLDKSENNYNMCKSLYTIEYNIFDLLNLYKNFDFDNNQLVIYAH
jgi:tRNA G10  N-methylase Trm11